MTFGDGTVPYEISWELMVLLPKGRGGYQGIDLVEVLWKVCSVVVNCCFKMIVVLHDALHGFREGRGIGTAALQANLEHYLYGIAHKPLLQVSLDVYKAYDSLDRGRFLEILKGCGLGPNLARLLNNY